MKPSSLWLKERLVKQKNNMSAKTKQSKSQKIPKLRFAEFCGEWEEKKLGDVCKKESSGISANSLDENYGEYKIYGANGELKKLIFTNKMNPIFLL